MELYLTRIKCLLRNKDNVFWAFIFPILLGTFFYLSFGRLSHDEFLKTINIYMAKDYTSNELVEIIENITYGDNKKLFKINLQYTKDELENKYLNHEIKSYIYQDDNSITYKIHDNKLTETIVKNVLDEIIQMNALFQNNPDKIQEISQSLSKNFTYVEEMKSHTNPKADKLIIYFYSLIAMACKFGSYWGVGLIKDIQADESALATRINVTPTRKSKLIVSYSLAAITLHFLGNLGLIFYLRFILKIVFANNLGLIILTSLVGTISGIALGSFLSAIIKASPGKKEGIMTIITLTLSFLSGLMIVDVKYFISKNVPILGLINPVNLITDCFYSLYYYNDIGKYFFNLSILALISIILIIATYFRLRGTKYDSI